MRILIAFILLMIASPTFASPQLLLLAATKVAGDSTAPVVTAFTIGDPVYNAVPITNFTATDSGGVTGYIITESSTPPLAGAAGWTANQPTSYTSIGIGNITLYAWAKDASGNISAAISGLGCITSSGYYYGFSAEGQTEGLVGTVGTSITAYRPNGSSDSSSGISYESVVEGTAYYTRYSHTITPSGTTGHSVWISVSEGIGWRVSWNGNVVASGVGGAGGAWLEISPNLTVTTAILSVATQPEWYSYYDEDLEENVEGFESLLYIDDINIL
jgi:hypothetical protein